MPCSQHLSAVHHKPKPSDHLNPSRRRERLLVGEGRKPVIIRHHFPWKTSQVYTILIVIVVPSLFPLNVWGEGHQEYQSYEQLGGRSPQSIRGFFRLG
ncbi:hypothetical protein BCR42DRAFT_416084 [Absidia repens]|uniref:Uncharacterized protein n=1 Tax=Absidia repens TaxID=90262 RepID=A0A1X2IGD0_9FUNG|nr:hypothetical protein BCR42DRAFT_416084 [Absidia repens]